MSDMELHPEEVVVGEGSSDEHPSVTIIDSRDVPLGGVRAMNVRRTIPHRLRRTIGAWCFADHFGPDSVAESGGMLVPPHPHTGLQTVSWLFQGEVEHRDSLGSHQLIAPGEMNLMTAGVGISHSEVSTTREPVLRGVQLWTVLPRALRNTEPSFSHTVAESFELDALTGQARLFLFIGELAGVRARAQGFSPLLGAEVTLPPNGELTLVAEPSFEYGVLLDDGALNFQGIEVPRYAMAASDTGATQLHFLAGANGARLILLGGEPLHERFVMWWNFIGDTHQAVVDAREGWMSEVVDVSSTPVAPAPADQPRFREVEGFDGPPLPAPVMPNAELKAR